MGLKEPGGQNIGSTRWFGALATLTRSFHFDFISNFLGASHKSSKILRIWPSQTEDTHFFGDFKVINQLSGVQLLGKNLIDLELLTFQKKVAPLSTQCVLYAIWLQF